MSDAHHEESAIKTPKQLILAIIAGFLVPIICIVLLVEYVTNDRHTGAGSDNSPEAIAKRIKPVASDGYTLKDVNAPKVLKTADEVYKSTCAACHGTGAAGAPKMGDVAAWKARIAEGYDTLAKHAIEGLRAMPPKGGNPDLDDIEVERVVVLMANSAGAKFAEPAVPAPAAAAPAGGASGTAASTPAAAPAK